MKTVSLKLGLSTLFSPKTLLSISIVGDIKCQKNVSLNFPRLSRTTGVGSGVPFCTLLLFVPSLGEIFTALSCRKIKVFSSLDAREETLHEDRFLKSSN